MMKTTPSLLDLSPLEAYHDRIKRKTMDESSLPSSPHSLHAAAPFFIGDFLRTCVGPSSHKLEGVGSSGDGCFGIRIGDSGGRGGGCGLDGTTPINKIAEDDDNDPMALIAKAMTNMSLVERERAYEDLHGVSAAVHETPELIAETLYNMERCLENIHHKPAYNMAVNVRRAYVQDPKLRLMFLRADRFDAELAARRLVKFMDWKLKLFGQEKLCQSHIGLDDLDGDARFMIESGYDQVLPSRDSRGRAVLVIAANYQIRLIRSIRATLQMVYYMYQCMAEDETNQKIGLVVIAYCLGQKDRVGESEQRDSVWESTKLAFCMPVRIEASHFCMPKNAMHFTLNLAAKSAGLFLQARLRVHVGSHMECEYALLSFGLPSNLLPFTNESELKTGHHKKWFQRRLVKEQELVRGGGVFSGIDLPRRNDVLLGQGRPIQGHPGNQRLQELNLAYYDEYNQASRCGGRAIVARKIIWEIWRPSCPLGRIAGDGGGGRFLRRREDKLNSGWWEEVTDELVLIEKVCNAVRGVRKRKHNNNGAVAVVSHTIGSRRRCVDSSSYQERDEGSGVSSSKPRSQ